MGGRGREHDCAGSRGLRASDVAQSFLVVKVRRRNSHL